MGRGRQAGAGLVCLSLLCGCRMERPAPARSAAAAPRPASAARAAPSPSPAGAAPDAEPALPAPRPDAGCHGVGAPAPPAQIVATVFARTAAGRVPAHLLHRRVSGGPEAAREAAWIALCGPSGWRTAELLRSQFRDAGLFTVTPESLRAVDRTDDGADEIEVRLAFRDSFTPDPPSGPRRSGRLLLLFPGEAPEGDARPLVELFLEGHSDTGVALDQRSLRTAHQFFTGPDGPGLHVAQSLVVRDDGAGEGRAHGGLRVTPSASSATLRWKDGRFAPVEPGGTLLRVEVPGY